MVRRVYSPRQLVQLDTRAADDLVNDRLDLALVGRGGFLDGEPLARFRGSVAGLVVGVVAIVDGALQGVGVPTILEVPVPGKSSGITR